MNYYLDRLMIDNEIKKDLIAKGAYTGVLKQILDEQLARHKREYRADLKRETNLYCNYKNARIVNGFWKFDGGWMKVFFPGEHWTEEEKEKFISDNWKRVRYSAYDCTGDTFTEGISVFNVPRGVVAYIFEGVDV